MSTVSITANIGGSMDADDRRALRYIIGLRNTEIAAENAALAAQTPPGTPIAVLPTSTNAELKSSGEAILARTLASAFASYVSQSKEDSTRLTQEQRKELNAAVNDLLSSGQSYSAILAKLA